MNIYSTPSQRLSQGVYTFPDVSRILQIPSPKVGRWVRGLSEPGKNRTYAVGEIIFRGEGRAATVSFPALIEIFVIAQLRQLGVSTKVIRDGRAEIGERFHLCHPFTFQGLLTDGSKLLAELGPNALLELGKQGQTAFKDVLDPFLHKLDFDQATQAASRFYPQGREKSIIVDPRHAFGRPTIEHTNITTEAIFRLVQGGDALADIASDFDLQEKQIIDALEFESRSLKAA